MKYFFKLSLWIFLIFTSNVYAQTHIDKITSLSLDEKVPKLYQQKVLEDGFKSFYFDGAIFEGKPTRIFSYYKQPEGPGPFPAVVLVHGGGGSAYKEWVEQWNNAGFAAISIAVEGQTAVLTGNKKKSNKWVKHSHPGPSRYEIYKDSDKPLSDQWMFHAVTATINAHNLLRSFEEIKKDEIGVSGISWGGVITSTTIGFDQRFAFAIPIYGSGFLDGMDNQYGRALKHNNVYREVWEPGLRIAKFSNPTFWLTGLQDKHFSLDAQASTYKLLKSEHIQSIQPDLKHGHFSGWRAKEPYLFAQKVINKKPLVKFFKQKYSNGRVSIRVNNIENITSASLFYTKDNGHTSEREWTKEAANVDIKGTSATLISKLPKNTKAWFFNIKVNGLIYSSEWSEHYSNIEI